MRCSEKNGCPPRPLLQLLGLIMPFRLLSNVFMPLLWGVGHPRISATNLTVAALLMPLAFYIGTHWGVLGLAYAWLAMYPVVYLFSVFCTCRAVGVPVPDYFRQLVRPLLAGLVMYAVVLALGSLSGGVPGEWGYLLQLVLAGILAYGLAMLALDRDSLRDTVDLLRS